MEAGAIREDDGARGGMGREHEGSIGSGWKGVRW
jgi:hypothetical protein